MNPSNPDVDIFMRGGFPRTLTENVAYDNANLPDVRTVQDALELMDAGLTRLIGMGLPPDYDRAVSVPLETFLMRDLDDTGPGSYYNPVELTAPDDGYLFVCLVQGYYSALTQLTTINGVPVSRFYEGNLGPFGSLLPVARGDVVHAGIRYPASGLSPFPIYYADSFALFYPLLRHLGLSPAAPQTLPKGSQLTASLVDGQLQLGLPRGEPGADSIAFGTVDFSEDSASHFVNRGSIQAPVYDLVINTSYHLDIDWEHPISFEVQQGTGDAFGYSSGWPQYTVTVTENCLLSVDAVMGSVYSEIEFVWNGGLPWNWVLEYPTTRQGWCFLAMAGDVFVISTKGTFETLTVNGYPI